jgi:thiol-disulfide isomerase/thioredoxin
MRRREALAALFAAGAGWPAAACAAAALPSPLDKFVKTDPPRLVEYLAITGGDGRKRELGAWRGQLVVLNLWGSWCFACRDEMPALSRLAASTQGRNIAVLPLAIERHGAEAVTSFFSQTGITNLPVLLGEGENIAAVFAAWGLPYTVLIDPAGREIGRVTGPARWDDPAAIAWLAETAAA